MVVAVVGEPLDLASRLGQSDEPEIGSLVGVLIALEGVGDHHQAPSIRTPNALGHVDAERGHLDRRLGLAGLCAVDVL